MEVAVLVVCFILIPFICYSQGSADVNLAFNKTATQSTNYGSYFARNAVNGILDDFSHTASAGTQWWLVDLGHQCNIGRIELYNRPGYYSRLAEISVLIGHGSKLPDPSLGSNRWTNVSYQEAPYGAIGIVSLNPPISARHVAVLSSAGNDDMYLNLVEVEIYSSRKDYTKSPGVTTTQSSTYNYSEEPELGPSKYAVDGKLSTFSASLFEQDGWWRIDLGVTVLFSYAVVYVRDGKGCKRSYICSDRLKNVYFVTKDSSNITTPNRDGKGGWNVCNSSIAALGDNFTIRCSSDSSNLTPLTRQFSILTFGGDGIALKEVQLFGYDIPKLSDLNGSVDVRGYTYITVSFDQWNQAMTGGPPPNEYRVRINDTMNQTVRIQNNSDISVQRRSGVTFSQLSRGETYDIEISCKIRNHSCSGDVYRFSATTVDCADPAQPKFHISSLAENLVELDNITISLHLEPTEHNCRSFTQYNVTVTNTASGVIRRFTRQDIGVLNIADLDARTNHKISVVAVNDKGLSSERIMFYLARETREIAQIPDIPIGALFCGVAGCVVAVTTVFGLVYLVWRRRCNEAVQCNTRLNQSTPLQRQIINHEGPRGSVGETLDDEYDEAEPSTPIDNYPIEESATNKENQEMEDLNRVDVYVEKPTVWDLKSLSMKATKIGNLKDSTGETPDDDYDEAEPSTSVEIYPIKESRTTLRIWKMEDSNQQDVHLNGDQGVGSDAGANEIYENWFYANMPDESSEVDKYDTVV